MPPANHLFTRDELSAFDLAGVRFPFSRHSDQANHEWGTALHYSTRYCKKKQTPEIIVNAGLIALRRRNGFV